MSATAPLQHAPRLALAVALAVLAGLLAGCNQLFGLDPTDPLPVGALDEDEDNDGIADYRDNCPLVANPDQADADDDDLGDACDGCDHCERCAIGPSHDEDGDRHADGCDNCPAVANPTQANADGDDLGDACELAAGVQRRVLFDGFGTLSDAWIPNTRWTADADTVGPVPDQPHADKFRLTHLGAPLSAGTPWRIEVGFDLVSATSSSQFVGIHPVDASGVGSFLMCALRSTDAGWAVTAGAIDVPTATPTPLVLRAHGTGATGSETSTCTVVGGGEATATLTAPSYPIYVQIFEDVPARIRYVDVVQ